MRVSLVALLFLLTSILSTSWMLAQDAQEEDQPRGPREREQLEKQFEELMNGAELMGSITVDSADGEKRKALESRITMHHVGNMRPNIWRFHFTVRAGEKSANINFPVRVIWSGDTPVIMLTRRLVPEFGMCTARVLIFGDQYAGVWSTEGQSGHLFGRIVRPEPPEEAQPAKPDDVTDDGTRPNAVHPQSASDGGA